MAEKFKIVNGTLSTGVSSEDISLGSGFGTPGYAKIIINPKTALGLDTNDPVGETVGFHDGTNNVSSFKCTLLSGGVSFVARRGVQPTKGFHLESESGTVLVSGTMSFGSDKVTLTYTTQPGSAYVFSLRVIQGGSLEHECGYLDGTSQTVTTGFACNDANSFIEFHGASTDSASATNGAYNYGYYSNGTQACWRYGTDEGGTHPAQFNYFDDDAVCRNIFGPTGVFDKYKVTGSSSTGFTMTVTSGPEQCIYSAVRISQKVAVGTFTTTAATGTGDAITGLGGGTPWTPGFISVAGKAGTSVDTISDDADDSGVFHGDYDGTTYMSRYFGFEDLTVSPFSESNWLHAYDDKIITARNNRSGAAVYATVNSFDSGGVTFNKSTGDMAVHMVYLAVEEWGSGTTTVDYEEGESAVLGEDLSQTFTDSLDGDESLALGESVELLEGKTEEESLSVGEDLTQVFTDSLSSEESLVISDSMVINLHLTLRESLVLGESAIAEDSIDEAESITFGESLSITQTDVLSEGESLAIADSLADISVVSLQDGESLVLSETFTFQSTGSVFEESLAFGETLTRQVTVNLTIDESLNLGETLNSAQSGEFVPSIWGKYKELNVPTEFVEGSAKVNFPVLLTITDPDIVSQVRSDLNDFVITNDVGDLMDYEVDYYDGSTLKVWVRVPVLAKDIQIVETEAVRFGETAEAVGGTESIEVSESLVLGEYERTSPETIVLDESLSFGEGFPSDAGGSLVSSITRNGITWYLDGLYFAGQYVTGDWWVLGTPNVGVLSVSPAWDGTGNGSSTNPPVSSEYGYGRWFGDASTGGRYEPAYRTTFPTTLSPGDSLVSTEQITDWSGKDLIGRNLSVDHFKVKRAEILTCVSSTPSPTAFRPPYSGSSKPTYDFADVDFSLLPSLALQPGTFDGSAPFITDWTDFARVFSRPWILHGSDWVGRPIHPSENMPNYHEYVYGMLADAACLLISDLSPTQKQDLLIGFLQVGIDTYNIQLEGTPDSSACKLPVLFAGLLLNQPQMLDAGSSYRTEFMTYYPGDKQHPVTSGVVPAGEFWTGATVGWRQDPGQNEHENFDPYTEASIPAGGWEQRESYRRINSPPWVGLALAAETAGVKQAWNHDEFFDYVNRWRTEGDPTTVAGFPWPQQRGAGGASSTFCGNMWDAHYGTTNFTMATSVTRHGITWTFDKAYPVGNYISGDPWVVGPVDIISTTPESSLTDGHYLHGSQIDLQPRAASTGFDSRLFDGFFGSASNEYDHAQNATFGISSGNPLRLNPGESLIKVISRYPYPGTGDRGGFTDAAVLTVVTAPPPSDAFRPPYCTATDQSYRFKDVNLGLLTNSFYATANTPSLTDKYIEAVIDGRLFLEWKPTWLSRYTHPVNNLMDYGQHIMGWHSHAALMLHSNHLTLQQKESILKGIIQMGIDLDGLYAKGMGWSADGGHMQGRKLTIMLKRAFLGEATNLGDSPTSFQENDQTHYVQETSPGVYNYGYGGYTAAMVGMPEWAFRHYSANPQGSQNYSSWTQDPYRLCCTSVEWYATQMIVYAMGLRTAWNHEPFFDYQDRFSQRSTGAGSVVSNWGRDMWTALRSNYTTYPVAPLDPSWP